jgi:hypothetical protein
MPAAQLFCRVPVFVYDCESRRGKTVVMQARKNVLSKRWLIVSATAVLLSFFAAPVNAQGNEKVLDWWPDLQQGLLWTGTTVGGETAHENYEHAVQACRNLELDGMTGWRLPTIDEIDQVMGPPIAYPARYIDHQGVLQDTDRVVTESSIRFDSQSNARRLWSSTPGPNGKMVAELVMTGGNTTASKGDHLWFGAYCVRPMTPEIAELVNRFATRPPIRSVAVLRSLGPLIQAHQAYVAHDFTTSLAYAQQAVILDPQSGHGYYAEGVSEANLRHWDEAIAAFKMAKTVHFNDMDRFIAWAERAKKEKISDDPSQSQHYGITGWNFDPAYP